MQFRQRGGPAPGEPARVRQRRSPATSASRGGGGKESHGVVGGGRTRLSGCRRIIEIMQSASPFETTILRLRPQWVLSQGKLHYLTFVLEADVCQDRMTGRNSTAVGCMNSACGDRCSRAFHYIHPSDEENVTIHDEALHDLDGGKLHGLRAALKHPSLGLFFPSVSPETSLARILINK